MLNVGTNPKVWGQFKFICIIIHFVEVLYLGYCGLPVTAQQHGLDRLHQQRNDWDWVSSARDGPTTLGWEGGGGATYLKGIPQDNAPCRAGLGTSREPNNRLRCLAPKELRHAVPCLAGHDDEHRVLQSEGS
jgi:hypothetical protein